ncbi:hypothetical protein [Paenibacillus sp. YIM B09110]|uniref:hypothetical protein n=1 Tax=Paenibacillus sp. YIM B09110 TaxID=3126102 RepID=UPI00301BCF98
MKLILKLKWIAVASVSLIALAGCSNETNQNSTESHEEEAVYEKAQETESVTVQLTMATVTDALQAAGLEIREVAQTESERDWILDHVKPTRYTVCLPTENIVPAKLERVSLYVFDSENARTKGLEDFRKQTAMYDMMMPRMYEIHNVMIFYWSHADMDQTGRYERYFESAVASLSSLSDAA